MKFSASGIKRFVDCPGKFWQRYGLNAKEDDNEFALVGREVHDLIRYHTGAKNNPPPVVMQESLDLFGRWESRFLPELDPADVLSVEEQVFVQIGKHEVELRFDDCRDIGGFLTVTDWKTTFKFVTVEEMKRDVQVRLYCVAAFKLFPSYDEMVFRIGNVRHLAYQTLEIEKAEADEWAEALELQMNLIEANFLAKQRGDAGALQYTPGKPCLTCGYFRTCEARDVFEKKWAGIKTKPKAVKAVERLALLEAEKKVIMQDLKDWVEAKGSVEVNGMTWAWWVTQSKKVDTGAIPEDDPVSGELAPYMVINDKKDSPLWEDGHLVKKLSNLGAIREKTSRRFDGKVAGEQEGQEE